MEAPIRRWNKGGGVWSDWALDKKGYVIRWKSSNRKTTVQLQHVLIMENHLGRKLLPEETVHHKNNIKHDNRLTNLELWSGNQPTGARVDDLLDWAAGMVELYAKELPESVVNRIRGALEG